MKTHLIAQGIPHAGRHMGNDPDPFASIFCRLELADSESQNAIGVASDRYKSALE